MRVTKDQEQETLWDTTKYFIQRHDDNKARVILKTTIEKSLKRMNVYTPTVSNLNFVLPEENHLEELRKMENHIRVEMIQNQSEETFQKVADYIKMVCDITEEPELSYREMIGSIFAKKSNLNRPKHYKPRSIAEIEVIKNKDLSSMDWLRQQLAEKKEVVPEKSHYSTSEAAKKLGLSDPTIRRMCETGRFKGAYRSGGENGHWRIPEYNFITTKEQDQKAEMLLTQLDNKNKKVGDVDEFDL